MRSWQGSNDRRADGERSFRESRGETETRGSVRPRTERARLGSIRGRAQRAHGRASTSWWGGGAPRAPSGVAPATAGRGRGGRAAPGRSSGSGDLVPPDRPSAEFPTLQPLGRQTVRGD